MEENKTIDRGEQLARIVVFGDLHLSSKDYGQHNDYPNESFNYFKQMGDIAVDMEATHTIYAGDLSYGRFPELEYLARVETELERQKSNMRGNLWVVKGNHDTASYGMTIYEYLQHRGYFKGSETLHIGRNEFVMTDYGKEEEAVIDTTGHYRTIMLGHNWFTFEDMAVHPNAKKFPLDHYDKWFGIDGVISGHIHQFSYNKGFIRRTNPTTGQSEAHNTFVWQLSCWARPQFIKEGNPNTGEFAIITVYEKGYTLDSKHIALLPLEQSFNMAAIHEEMNKAEVKKEHHIDMQDIIHNLETYTSGFANPEDILMGMAEYDIRYRQKAVEILKASQG